MTIAEEIEAKGITEVLHFTTNPGLVGTLATGFLKSRRMLPKEKYLAYIVHSNAKTRPEESPFFDKSEDWLDFVNLSISEINSRFFRLSGDWRHNKDVWWIILSFDPVIMTHENVFFATTNNGYEHCVRGQGVEGLHALFNPVIARKGSWRAYRGARAPSLATCEQAEVLYPRELSVEYLRKAYVRTGDDADRVSAMLRQFGKEDVVVQIDPRKFAGAQN